MDSGLKMRGDVRLRVIPKYRQAPLLWKIKNGLRPGFWGGWCAVQAAKLLSRMTGIPTVTSRLSVKKALPGGHVVDYGVVGYRVVTDTGVNFMVDAFQGNEQIRDFNYHGIGSNAGATAEGAGNTALDTEFTTELDPDSTRATGTQGEGASANIYQTVGTLTVDSAVGVEEHGIFDQAATGGGTLWDRTVFSVVNLSSGESIECTYELTVNSGG